MTKGKNKKSRKISAIIIVACIALMGYFLFTIVSLGNTIQQRKANKDEIMKKIDVEKKNGQELKDEIATIGTEKFIERHARDIFGYVKENEKVFYDINNN